ncbi:uncharacterized protein C7orf57 homolog [Amia ocellicauda]|uniref:uncharacterized protein C7orf57 homolog n=1 Tax=Amia ocellicauda TaxID=2972642 RepID=UPI003463E1D1
MSVTEKDQQANGAVGPSSQIPGLGYGVDMGPEKITHGRRTGVFESDSDYVKLAKRGGQKGLLWHEDTNVDSKTNSNYKPPDWFSAESESQEQQSTSKRTIPDYMTSEEFQKSPTKGTFQPLDAPFGTDNKTTWEREPDSFTSGKNKMELNHPVDQMEDLTLTSPNSQEGGKFKKTSFDKKQPPVSMQKLLSFGYADDWHAVNKGEKDDEGSSIESEHPSAITPDQDLS